MADGSLYDELLVVRPPKRIVGGLMVGMAINIFLLPTLYVWSAGDRDVLPTPEAEFDETE